MLSRRLKIPMGATAEHKLGRHFPPPFLYHRQERKGRDATARHTSQIYYVKSRQYVEECNYTKSIQNLITVMFMRNRKEWVTPWVNDCFEWEWREERSSFGGVFAIFLLKIALRQRGKGVSPAADPVTSADVIKAVLRWPVYSSTHGVLRWEVRLTLVP